TDSAMCAGVGDGKDASKGESGGPLIANGVLVGIVSSGAENCGEMPGLYTRV
ncbi:serine protease trypsin-like protein, partial [Phytophthora sojae]